MRHRGFRLHCSVLSGALLAGAVQAAPLFPLRTFSVGDGLPSAQIQGLAQDASGRLWILTRTGVTAYDGHRFEPQGSASGLPALPLAALGVDAAGRVLVATQGDGRVYRLEDGRWRELPALPLAETQPPDRVVRLVGGDTAEAVVAGTTASGLWLWDGAAWTNPDRPVGLRSATVTALVRLPDRVAVGTGAGLCWLEARRLDCTPRQREPRLGDAVLALSASSTGASTRLVVMTRQWVGALQDGKLSVRTDGPDARELGLRYDARTPLAAVGEDRTGGLYFGTPYQLYFLGPGDATPGVVGQAEGLLGQGVTSILTDREGGVWVAGLRGLGRIGSRRFLSLDERSGLAENEVTALAEPRPGTIIVGHNRALTFVEGDRFERRPLAELPGISEGGIPRVLDLAVAPDGTTWAAAALALLEIRPDRSIRVHAPFPRVLAVELDPRGRLWVAGNRELRVRIGTRFEAVGPALPAGSTAGIRWLATDGRQRLFAATTRGVLWRDGVGSASLVLDAPWGRLTSRDGRGDDVYAVLATPTGRVLAGTSSGLYAMVDDRLVKAEGALALDRPVYFLRLDRRGRIWAGTDDGVFVQQAQGFRQLTVRHGLVGRETNRGAVLVDHEGRIWIGTDQGLSIYREAEDLAPLAAPVVEIEAIESAGERYRPEQELSLSSRQRALRFLVGAIAFSTEQDVAFRYRLEGFDAAWQGPFPPPAAGIRYTNLPPGRYRFRIAAGWGGSGAWGPEVSTAEILIAPPLWRQPWFVGLVAASLIAFAGALHSWRTRPLRRQARALAEVNARLEASLGERQHLIQQLEARNLELERFAYTASHDLKAPLVTVRAYVDSIAQDARDGRLDRMLADVARVKSAAGAMAELLDHVLEVSRAGLAIGALAPVPLAPLVREAAGRVRGIDRVELRLAEELPTVPGDRIRLLEVFENLLGNAVKFMGAQAAPRIEVGVRPSPAGPIVFVSDNGVGIDPAFQERAFDLFERFDARGAGSGVGLAIVKRIVNGHGGRIWVESSGVPGEGARFCLQLPLAEPAAQASASGEAAPAGDLC